MHNICTVEFTGFYTKTEPQQTNLHPMASLLQNETFQMKKLGSNIPTSFHQLLSKFNELNQKLFQNSKLTPWHFVNSSFSHFNSLFLGPSTHCAAGVIA